MDAGLKDILTGRTDHHVRCAPNGVTLQPAVLAAWQELRSEAARAGLDLRVASGFRSFAAQQRIWDAKLEGVRPVLNDAGQPLALLELPPLERLHAVLRFSALPGASRHHWGTDLDVYDAAGLSTAYQLQLTADEWSDSGPFAAANGWLSERLAREDGWGFFRPYDVDRGGVAPEPWHLSYRPLAERYAAAMSTGLVRELWLDCEPAPRERTMVLAHLDDLFSRYVRC
jgi:LAS superfamily LD-carboxypeptidase LdcB